MFISIECNNLVCDKCFSFLCRSQAVLIGFLFIFEVIMIEPVLVIKLSNFDAINLDISEVKGHFPVHSIGTCNEEIGYKTKSWGFIFLSLFEC